MRRIIVILGLVFLLTSCSAEVGSAAWCTGLKDKPKEDWSMSEIKDYGKHCVFK